jgi:hypothetical protein
MDKIKRPRPQKTVSPMDTLVKTDQEDLTPTPEQTRRMMEQVEEEKRQTRMNKAYDEAAPRSMRLGFATGGSVSSASSRADGCAQRGKTKGRII